MVHGRLRRSLCRVAPVQLCHPPLPPNSNASEIFVLILYVHYILTPLSTKNKRTSASLSVQREDSSFDGHDRQRLTAKSRKSLGKHRLERLGTYRKRRQSKFCGRSSEESVPAAGSMESKTYQRLREAQTPTIEKKTQATQTERKVNCSCVHEESKQMRRSTPTQTPQWKKEMSKRNADTFARGQEARRLPVPTAAHPPRPPPSQKFQEQPEMKKEELLSHHPPEPHQAKHKDRKKSQGQQGFVRAFISLLDGSARRRQLRATVDPVSLP